MASNDFPGSSKIFVTLLIKCSYSTFTTPISHCKLYTFFLAGDWVARDHKGGMHVPTRYKTTQPDV